MPSLKTQTIAAFCTLAFSAAAWSGERHFEKRFPAAPGTALLVDSDLGSITLRGAATREVSVVVDMRGSDKDLARFEVTAEQTPAGIAVRGRRTKSGWSLFNWSDLDVRIVINAPRNCAPRLHTAGADIEVTDVLGSLQARTSGGGIRIRAVEGTAELTTSGGSIQAVDTKGALKLRTSGGHVSVNGAIGSVDAGTSGGNVNLGSVNGHVRAGTSGGSVTVEVCGENSGIEAKTSGGNVTISVAKTVRATIDAATSGGDVACDLPVTTAGRIGGTSVRGDANGGGPLIYARTSGGNVRIRALQ